MNALPAPLLAEVAAAVAVAWMVGLLQLFVAVLLKQLKTDEKGGRLDSSRRPSWARSLSA